ncbi:Adenosylcobinamide-phosphate guanylyltransferase [Roseibacterium elongatum DSM 19469]|uniref:Bifunctional adenosylcobalamin biosynthesis protein n=1 Tax=Roseicyclus elongatus DSM 19469 TaxID=1294273 RepID=W8RNW9_9RHOB|nr:bifunctional adenosylcobinamide kinase/adenosylcobinamide-phosphate guanylyltransferase [Roseibacterium elongatum]AHM02844.1 Adenosylcobinamide-phosphate guanylyltransferase [Roseibacterium elongatum DSM 19469]
MQLPPITLVLGGTASGKSAFAERLVRVSRLAKVYLATAEAHDSETAERIAIHRKRRSGQGWRTVEAPRDLARALAQIDAEEVALVDCMTLWLSNLMLSDTDLDEERDLLSDVLDQLPAPVVLVSNDVGGGLVPDSAPARALQRELGRLNQQLAAQADLVVQVTAGLPLILKGTAPTSDTDRASLW